MPLDDLSHEELIYLVGTTDKELFESGMNIELRFREVPRMVMKKLGYVPLDFAIPGIKSPIAHLEDIFLLIYRRQDVNSKAQSGVFMYRDIFARVRVPFGYGRVSLKLFEFVDLTEIQLRMINLEPNSKAIYIDQFLDLFDIHRGSVQLINEYKKIEISTRYLGLARLHLHASAAILTGGYDYRGATQSSLLATELALKAGCTALGLTEDELKKKEYGHNSENLASFLGRHWSEFDAERVIRVINQYPDYVLNRYDANQPPRIDIGNIAMGAQYIVSEVIRQMSERHSHVDRDIQPDRQYPK